MSMSDMVKYEDFADITPGNTPLNCDGIYVGVSGNINVQGKYGSQVFPNVPVGVFPVQARRVLAANTTATNLVALWMNERPAALK